MYKIGLSRLIFCNLRFVTPASSPFLIYFPRKPPIEGQEFSSFYLIKQDWQNSKSSGTPGPGILPTLPSLRVHLKAKISWLTSAEGSQKNASFSSRLYLSVSLEKSNSRKWEVPGFFTGRQGVFQGNWQGTKMSVFLPRQYGLQFPYFVSKVTVYYLIWMPLSLIPGILRSGLWGSQWNLQKWCTVSNREDLV